MVSLELGILYFTWIFFIYYLLNLFIITLSNSYRKMLIKIAQARSLLLGQSKNENENAKRKANVFFNLDKSASASVSSGITVNQARSLLL